MSVKPLLVIDVDGPIVDYNLAYGEHWGRVFGEMPEMRNPKAYWAVDQWRVRKLKGQELEMFTASFSDLFWLTIPLVKNAKEDLECLSEQYRIIACATSDPRYNASRRQHLIEHHRLPIEDVISVGKSMVEGYNSKADTINNLQPYAVVDDLPMGLNQLDAGIKKFLFARNMKDPRHPKNRTVIDSRYTVINRLSSICKGKQTPEIPAHHPPRHRVALHERTCVS